MTEQSSFDVGTPTIEVRVFEGSRQIAVELCESEAEAAAVVDRWSEKPNVSWVVDDLSARHGPEDILAPELALDPDADDDRFE